MIYTRDELELMGIAVGEDVRVDKSVRFFRPECVRIGRRTRVDCFAVISAGDDGIVIGDNVHIACGCYLFGSGGPIVMKDYAGLSSHTAVYTASDAYHGGFMTGPTLPDEFRLVTAGPVTIDCHAVVGASSVIMPNVTLGYGAMVGALTLVRKSVGDCEIVTGNPMRTLPYKRDVQRLRELEKRYRNQCP